MRRRAQHKSGRGNGTKRVRLMSEQLNSCECDEWSMAE